MCIVLSGLRTSHTQDRRKRLRTDFPIGARGADDRVHEGRGGAFALRARDMNHVELVQVRSLFGRLH